MHNKRIAKLLILALSLAILLAGAFSILASADGAKTPEIISNNVSYDGNYSLMYAVDASTVNEAGAVTLKIFDKTPAEGVAPIASYTKATTETITTAGEAKEVYVFITAGVAAKDMGDVFYAVATDASGASSEVYTYSVAEYMLDRLYGGYELTESQKSLYTSSLATGAAAQKVLINDADDDASNDETLVTDLAYVTFADGTLNGKTGYSIYKKGDVLTLDMDKETEGVFDYYLDANVTRYYLNGIDAVCSEYLNRTKYTDTYTVECGGKIILGFTDATYKAGEYYNSDVAGTRYHFSEALDLSVYNAETNPNGLLSGALHASDPYTNGSTTISYTDGKLTFDMKTTSWVGFTIANKGETTVEKNDKIIAEYDFTFISNAAYTGSSSSDRQPFFYGITNSNDNNGNFHSQVYCSHLNKDFDAPLYIGNIQFEKGTTYNIRIEETVGVSTKVFVNGILATEYANSGSTTFAGIGFYVRQRHAGAALSFSLDNVFMTTIKAAE